MKIAVIDYGRSNVDIIVVDKAYIDDMYDGMTQDYLAKEHKYNLDNIDFTTGIKGINIIDQDDINQMC